MNILYVPVIFKINPVGYTLFSSILHSRTGKPVPAQHILLFLHLFILSN
jgi:hypothetical protein